ncbi:MAG: hypothetical protein AB3N16_05780 [Flavobacteriaceae bacterium]
MTPHESHTNNCFRLVDLFNERQSPIFYTVYNEYFSEKDKEAYPYHLVLTVETRMNTRSLDYLQSEFEEQQYIENTAESIIAKNNGIKKVFALIRGKNKIEYHWYLEDPQISREIERLNNVRSLKINLTKDPQWENVTAYFNWLDKNQHQKSQLEEDPTFPMPFLICLN